jgi:hypothetical protein
MEEVEGILVNMYQMSFGAPKLIIDMYMLCSKIVCCKVRFGDEG